MLAQCGDPAEWAARPTDAEVDRLLAIVPRHADALRTAYAATARRVKFLEHRKKRPGRLHRRRLERAGATDPERLRTWAGGFMYDAGPDVDP